MAEFIVTCTYPEGHIDAGHREMSTEVKAEAWVLYNQVVAAGAVEAMLSHLGDCEHGEDDAILAMHPPLEDDF